VQSVVGLAGGARDNGVRVPYRAVVSGKTLEEGTLTPLFKVLDDKEAHCLVFGPVTAAMDEIVEYCIPYLESKLRAGPGGLNS
jgi:hypothetical protein